MTFHLYKLDFDRAHFGGGNLDTATLNFGVDRLFSALQIEALGMSSKVSEQFQQMFQNEQFAMTDAFPYFDRLEDDDVQGAGNFDTTYFIPKPIVMINRTLEQNNAYAAQNNEDDDTRKIAKKVKKIEFIPVEKYTDYLAGSLDLEALSKIAESVDKIYKITVDEKTAISRDQNAHSESRTDLFNVGVTSFAKDAGLYFVTHFADKTEAENVKLFETLLTSLQFSGIGGKRTAGFGRFTWNKGKIPNSILQSLAVSSDGTCKTQGSGQKYMSLTTALPKDDKLEGAMDDATYLLTKSSGYAYSVGEKAHATSPLRKKDLYKFTAGSVFTTLWQGDIFDVRPNDFPHEVLNFARPIFLKLPETTGNNVQGEQSIGVVQ